MCCRDTEVLPVPCEIMKLLFVADSASFVDGFRGIKADLPPICILRGAVCAGFRYLLILTVNC